MVTYLAILYILVLALAFHYGNFIAGFGVLILEIISLFFIPVIINKQKENIRSIVKSENIAEPILNINKAPWYLFAQLPEITQLEAKKMVHLRRRYGKYKSLDDFFKVNLISNEKRALIEKYLFV